MFVLDSKELVWSIQDRPLDNANQLCCYSVLHINYDSCLWLKEGKNGHNHSHWIRTSPKLERVCIHTQPSIFCLFHKESKHKLCTHPPLHWSCIGLLCFVEMAACSCTGSLSHPVVISILWLWQSLCFLSVSSSQALEATVVTWCCNACTNNAPSAIFSCTFTSVPQFTVLLVGKVLEFDAGPV